MNMPSREEVALVIDRLLAGAISREEASLWAGALHVVEAADPVIEKALDILTLIDGRHIDEAGRPMDYLYDFEELVSVRRVLDETADE